MTKVTKRTFLGTLQFYNGIIGTNTDWVIEAYDVEEANMLLDKKLKEERAGIVDDNYNVDINGLREFKSYEQLIELIQVLKVDHEMSSQVLKIVDMCEELDVSEKCTEGCDIFVSVDYGEPKIEINGSEMSARHIGKCMHDVVIYDKTEVYKVVEKDSNVCQCANRTRTWDDDNSVEHCNHCHKATGN